MASNKPVVVEYTKNSGEYLKGSTFVVSSASKAEKLHPDAKVIGYEDGSPMEQPKASGSGTTPANTKGDAKAEGDSQ